MKLNVYMAMSTYITSFQQEFMEHLLGARPGVGDWQQVRQSNAPPTEPYILAGVIDGTYEKKEVNKIILFVPWRK